MRELAESRDGNTIARLIRMLGEEDVAYRRSAVVALGVIGPDAVSPLAALLLNSDNVTIRASCAKALAQIALNWPEVPFPSEGMEALKTAITDLNPVVHIASVMALGEIGSPALDILVEALQTTENLAAAVAIINALGSMGDNRAIEVLTKLKNDQSADEYLRESAVSALARLDFVSNYQKSE